jgi:hypothetical protein
MSRVRYNNATGLTGAPLSSDGDTITFAAIPPFATLTGDDIIVIPLEPPVAGIPSENYEITWMTAFTEGDNTGTILRGQEGTTAVAHLAGVVWANDPTVEDFSGGSYASLTGAGETETPGDLTQTGGLTVNDTEAHGINMTSYTEDGSIELGLSSSDTIQSGLTINGVTVSLFTFLNYLLRISNTSAEGGVEISDAGGGLSLFESGNGGIALQDFGTGGITIASTRSVSIGTGASGVTGSTALGQLIQASRNGEIASGFSEFIDSSPIQAPQLYLAAETTDATPTLMVVDPAGNADGPSTDLPLTNFCMSTIVGTVSAVSNDGTIVAAWQITAAIVGWAGSYRVVDTLGAVSVNLVGADAAAADWAVAVAATADGAGITVTGAAGVQASVTADSAPTLPLTIALGVNDQFVWDGETFVIAPAVYTTLADLETAVEAALTGGSTPFSLNIAVTDDGTNLVFTGNGNLAPPTVLNGVTITEGNGGAAAIGVTSPPDTFSGGTTVDVRWVCNVTITESNFIGANGGYP